MKNLFLIGLAASAMMVSCSNDETLEMAQSKAIGFSNMFVNNGTRSINDPSFTIENLENFAVYGFTQQGQIFDGVKVSKSGTNWTYSPIQYWVPGNTYTFGAIAPYSVAENGGVSGVNLPEKGTKTKVEMKVAYTNTDENQIDLLHAAPNQITGVTADYANPVAMTFSHQLSKVKFSFVNAVGEGYNVKVTNVKITDAKATGTLTIGTTENAWNEQNGSVTLSFGDVKASAETVGGAAIAYNNEMECCNEKLMIPTDNKATYTVTFTADLYKGDVLLGTYPHKVAIKNVALQLGYCYDFKATLTHENIVDPDKPLKPIEFEVTSVDGWDNTSENQTVDIPSIKDK